MERAPFGLDEWYHCYTRGVDKRKTFVARSDYERFLGLLYLCNSVDPIHRSDFQHPLNKLLSIPRIQPLVAIGTFCLMPNHFHLLLKEIRGSGISKFMLKLGTAYAMYFNKKYERIGNVFVRPYRSRHIKDDDYLQMAIQYIHCNPAEIFDPNWKHGTPKDLLTLERQLLTYPYSSFGAFQADDHMLRRIIDESIFAVETQLPPRKMLAEAREYYADVNIVKDSP